MTRRKAFKRAFFGWYRKHWNQHDLTSLLDTEWVTLGIVSQRSWSVPGKKPGSGTAYCEAVLGKPSWWVRPARSWKQRVKNYRFLRSGEIWFFTTIWPANAHLAPEYRPQNGAEINNISTCCYEHLILNPWPSLVDPEIWRLRCSKCGGAFYGSRPNGVWT